MYTYDPASFNQAAELAALKASGSKYAGAARRVAADVATKKLTSLEKRETACEAAAVLAAKAQRVRCFRCIDCSSLTDQRPMKCEAARHRVLQEWAEKRTFVCGSCGSTKASLGHAPKKPCLKCGNDRWTQLKGDTIRKVARGPEAEFRPALAEWTSRSMHLQDKSCK
jgi:tRNA(Ile2) C34 agmatinyltransferase TiaS